MKNKRKIALLLATIALAALLCACAGNGVTGEWKDETTGVRIVFEKDNKGAFYAPFVNTEIKNELTYSVDGDQLTICFINLDGSVMEETVVIEDGAFTYLGLVLEHQD